jgi:DNA/RNA-binding domain of Phe-tRNA-synthetase-like protein
MEIKLDQQLPTSISLAVTHVQFKNETYSEQMWLKLLNPLIAKVSERDTLETIRADNTIQATKQAYKVLGKDPARFRPSSDSLWRRVAKGKGLYQVNALVDLNNYLSLKYHLPFGSYDLSSLDGPIILTKGQTGQEYPGIGKKMINLENLLLLTDNQGPFGSPTSDSTRAMITEKTTQALIIGYVFGQDQRTQETMQLDTKEIVENYLIDGVVIEQKLISQTF